MSEIFKEFFEVRNNELDVQGIVANHSYMIYLTHARHKFVESLGLNLVELAKQKQNLVVLTCTMKYINSLGHGDKFYVTCKLASTEYPYQFAYDQEIKLVENDKKIMKARITSTCVNENAGADGEKLYIPEKIKELIK